MRSRLIVLCLFILITGCTHKYYIVRHAEKAAPVASDPALSKDPPLTKAGTDRANALLARLRDAGISQIFSTNYIRTQSTAAPLAVNLELEIQLYDTVDQAFIHRLKSLKENVLVVGHSNTIDDIINGLVPAAHMTDLSEAVYDNLFIIKRRGNRFQLVREKYGKPSGN